MATDRFESQETQDGIDALNSDIQVLTGTTGAVGASIYLSYPSGFNGNNSVVIGFQYKKSDESSWRTFGIYPTDPICAITVSTFSDSVQITARSSIGANCSFKVTLYRYA